MIARGIMAMCASLVVASCRATDDVPTPTAATCITTCGAGCPSAGASPMRVATFHGDRRRTGWNDQETLLTPARVASDRFGVRWTTEPFDVATIDGKTFAGRVYASPLYLDEVEIAGARESVLFVATSNGWVYAIRAFPGCNAIGESPRPAGAILWRTHVGAPVVVPKLDGGIPLGILGTPVIDVAARRLYVAAVDDPHRFGVYALDLSTGAIVPGWPVALDDASLGAVNGNGPALFDGAIDQSQRSALALSPDGGLLYVPFGSYYDTAVGWIAVVDAHAIRLAASFSGAPSLVADGNAGIWSAGGPAIDDRGRVFVTTGNSPVASIDAAHVWGQSMLLFDPMLHHLGSWTAFDYCELEKHDIDVGGSSPLLLPDLEATSTPHLVAFGGKQGTIYLLDRDHVPARTDRRRPCSIDASTDESLLPPNAQPQFGTRGPLNVFGPYTEIYGNFDFAKMRSTLAYFRDARGRHLLFATGATKAAVDSAVSIPPSIARLEVVTEPGASAYLRVDAYEPTLAFANPGSPVISSDGDRDAIVWVLDANAPRTASLVDPKTPHPMLYAVDATTMQVLYRSAPGLLPSGGKYSTPLVAHGAVFVGTDRISTFGVEAP